MRKVHRRSLTADERIAFALESIERWLSQLVEYRRIEEDRQKLYADFASGLIPIVQKHLADSLGPRHPFAFPRRGNPVPHRRARGKGTT